MGQEEERTGWGDFENVIVLGFDGHDERRMQRGGGGREERRKLRRLGFFSVTFLLISSDRHLRQLLARMKVLELS
jgi:hypothetical protein